jgi:hypothetical protein
MATRIRQAADLPGYHLRPSRYGGQEGSSHVTSVME